LGVHALQPRREAIIRTTAAEPMSDLYARLADTGFDPLFVRSVILPEWWEDSLAEVPANRAFAENLLARNLGMSIGDLSQPSAGLRLPSLSHVKFKRYKNTVDETVAPAILVAQRAAKIVVDASSSSLPQFVLPADALTVRQEILRRHHYVDLASLLGWCWEHGVVVMHLAKAPKGSKLFDGLAMFCGDRPVVVLGSRRDSPAWLAFHLAHELSHIIRRHVTPGSSPLADSDLKSATTDRQEREADRSACELLTGIGKPMIRNLRYNAMRLALFVAQEGPTRGVDPGVMALIYGKSNNRWPVAQNALKHLSLESGAHDMIAAPLKMRLNPEDLPESSERFLAVISI
jgi:hypothetical protein